MGYNIMGYNIKNLNNNNIIFYFLLILIILAGGNLFNRFFNNNKEGLSWGDSNDEDDEDDDDSGQPQREQKKQVNCEKTYGENTESFNYKKCEVENILSKIDNKVTNPAQHNDKYNEDEIKAKETLILNAYKTHKEWVKYNHLKDTTIATIKNTISDRFTSTNSSTRDTKGKDLEEWYNKINVGGALGAVGGALGNVTSSVSWP